MVITLIVAALTGKAICRFAYTLLTYKEQNYLFNLRRTAVNPDGKTTSKPMRNVVTRAKGRQSNHNFGMAFDIVLLKDTNCSGKFNTASWETNGEFNGDGKADWQEIVAICKRYGWEWGGDRGFVDKPHFQKTFGFSVLQLSSMVQQEKVYSGTN